MPRRAAIKLESHTILLMLFSRLNQALDAVRTVR